MRHGAHEKPRLRGRRHRGRRPPERRGHAAADHRAAVRPARALHHEPVARAHTHVPSAVAGQRGPGASDHRPAGRVPRLGDIQTVPEQPAAGPPATSTHRSADPRETAVDRTAPSTFAGRNILSSHPPSPHLRRFAGKVPLVESPDVNT